MSFALTTQQVRARQKDVTRRLGWVNLKVGDPFQPVLKCMGLRPGEKVQPLGNFVVTVSTRREPLQRMIDEPIYGKEECRREGFPEMSPEEFVAMFCKSHKNCAPATLVTRIEFSYKTQPCPT